MADPILHVKDSYYFEVPKFLARSTFNDKYFPEWWVRLDDQFQDWEAHRLYEKLEELDHGKESLWPLPKFSQLEHEYHEWKHHDHANHGKPFSLFLSERAEMLLSEYSAWKGASKENQNETLDTFLAQGNPRNVEHAWIAVRLHDPKWSAKWKEAVQWAGNDAAVWEFQKEPSIVWSPQKIEGYNNALHGKIIVPQPFATLKNLYEVQPGSGIGISKFMIIQAVVAFLIVAIFTWLAGRVRSSDRPQGKCWNLLEAILLFIRDQIARPSIDSHDHHDESHGHEEAGHAAHHAEHGAAGGHAPSKTAHHAAHLEHEGDKYVPYLWTIFLFILGCNLMGMLPWSGSPTAAFGVTIALAAVTFLVGFVSGVRKFGFVGYWKNQVPGMELPGYMAVVLLPVIFVIEVAGLFIKHGVLGIRLLANIAAGHLVLASLLALTFSAAGASEAMSGVWPFASVVVVLGSAALSCLELFVAFLQAYVFTLLSALFIGAAVHKH